MTNDKIQMTKNTEYRAPNPELIMTPGPTPVSPRVLAKMAEPIIHHRTPQYRQIFREISGLLQQVFMTEHPVLTFTSSGTGAMEAAVVNLFSAGDKVLVIQGGKFGERWTNICRAYGVEAKVMDVEWGKAVDIAEIEKILAENRIKAVFTTLCETSTGVLNDIASLGKIVGGTDTVLVVDAISGLCADELRTDEWGVDVAVSGSQKGLMIPPGLGFASISPKAAHLMESSNLPKFYFSFRKALDSLVKDDSPFTPAITLVLGLKEALEMINEEGIENVVQRCAEFARYTRNKIQGLGFELFSKNPSNALTAVNVPDGIGGKALIASLKEKYGITVAGGQGRLSGKIFRIAHMGYITKADIDKTLKALKSVVQCHKS